MTFLYSYFLIFFFFFSVSIFYWLANMEDDKLALLSKTPLHKYTQFYPLNVLNIVLIFIRSIVRIYTVGTQ